jgi:predicted lysophospholipase L1 biosynthesis ABC-type transport system permease subunit
VRVEGSSGSGVFRIVGQTVLAAMSDPAPLADGAAFTRAGLARVGADGGWNIVVRVAPGADRAAIAREFRHAAVFGGEIGPVLPAEIDRVRQIRDLPALLAVFVAVVALTAVGLALVASLRRRGRDLAVLKTLGFSRRQLRAAVAWQASTVAAVALVVGIPMGALVGTYFWRRVADELGVASDPAWPVLALVVVAVVALVAVNVVAAFPARRAAHTRPAVVLRSE